MTATQTGSKEITVVSETEFTGAEEFTVMKGAVEQSVAATEFDDDMCTVTLTMDGNIQEAEYTVICSDLEYEPASFTGEVGKLSAIVWNIFASTSSCLLWSFFDNAKGSKTCFCFSSFGLN